MRGSLVLRARRGIEVSGVLEATCDVVSKVTESKGASNMKVNYLLPREMPACSIGQPEEGTGRPPAKSSDCRGIQSPSRCVRDDL